MGLPIAFSFWQFGKSRGILPADFSIFNFLTAPQEHITFALA